MSSFDLLALRRVLTAVGPRVASSVPRRSRSIASPWCARSWYGVTPHPGVERMPTANPRVNVTLPSSLDSLLARLSRVERKSKSQVLRELLEAAEPALRRAVILMEKASSASESVRSGLAQAMLEAQLDVEEAVEIATATAQQLDLMDSKVRAIRASAAGARGATVRAPGGGSTPVPVTRGSGGRKRGGTGAAKGSKS
jgi:hypothetical protein